MCAFSLQGCRMTTFTISPTVDATQEFIEIANDFANPLDLVREAISNSFDARRTDVALEISISFDTYNDAGEVVFRIKIADNGTGMGPDEIQSFFDLGNSTRRGDAKTIGEKGHGTKVYFNCKKLTVETRKNAVLHTAILDAPFRKLHERQIPIVSVTAEPCAANE